MTVSADRPGLSDVLAGLEIRTKAFIDGEYVDAASGETFDCVSPRSGSVIAAVAACDAVDVDAAVRGARTAFESGIWSRSAPAVRKRVLIKLAALIEEHGEELALLETLDMGKPIRDSRAVDIPLAAGCISYYGEAVDKVYDEIAPTDPSSVVMVVREPLGVVGAVVPWNLLLPHNAESPRPYGGSRTLTFLCGRWSACSGLTKLGPLMRPRLAEPGLDGLDRVLRCLEGVLNLGLRAEPRRAVAGRADRALRLSDLAPRNRGLRAMNEPPVDPRALPRKANAPKMTMAQAAGALDRDRAGES